MRKSWPDLFLKARKRQHSKNYNESGLNNINKTMFFFSFRVTQPVAQPIWNYNNHKQHKIRVINFFFHCRGNVGRENVTGFFFSSSKIFNKKQYNILGYKYIWIAYRGEKGILRFLFLFCFYSRIKGIRVHDCTSCVCVFHFAIILKKRDKKKQNYFSSPYSTAKIS